MRNGEKHLTSGLAPWSDLSEGTTGHLFSPHFLSELVLSVKARSLRVAKACSVKEPLDREE